MRFPLPEPVRQTLSRLQRAGHEAYLVGGSVRDDLLGIKPHEYDITTSALPDQVKAVFEGERLIDTGLQHGTVTLLLGGQALEITTFRVDGSYTDARHPDKVSFSNNLIEDLQRRDFTCNAMAWSEQTGLVDPFGGAEACRLKVIEAVGDPRLRFEEDALRILRALRFASSLDFSITADTYQAMLAGSDRLALISRERVAKELNGLMLGKAAAQTLRTWPRILFAVLPDLEPMLHTPQRSRWHVHDVWEHTLRVVAASPQDLAIRWAALYHDSGKPASMTRDPDGTTHFKGHPRVSVQLAQEAMRSLRQSRKLSEEVALLVRHHDDRINHHNLQRWLAKLGLPMFTKLIRLQRADADAHAPHVSRRAPDADELIAMAHALVQSGAVLGLKDLALDGRQLIALGFPQNHLIGLALHHLLDQVLDHQLPNDQATLSQAALEWLKDKQESI